MRNFVDGLDKIIVMSKNNAPSKQRKRDRRDMIQYINLQLASLGQPTYIEDGESGTKYTNEKFQILTEGLINSFKEKSRLLGDKLSPVDTRIQNFIDDYLKEVECDKDFRLPNNTLVLNQKGMARELSLPPNGNEFKNDLLSSYRLKQGILNNPDKDKRTTKGTFHIVRGGLPVPLDKKEVPKIERRRASIHRRHIRLGCLGRSRCCNCNRRCRCRDS